MLPMRVTSLLCVIRHKPFKMHAPIPRADLSVALAVLSCALVLAACGSSGKPGGGSGSATASAGIKYADCMRAHGLRSFPDPTTSPPSTLPAPDAVFLGGPEGSFSLTASMVQSPAFEQAAPLCGFPFPASGHGFTMPVAAAGA
jgi:hypothetical protein